MKLVKGMIKDGKSRYEYYYHRNNTFFLRSSLGSVAFTLRAGSARLVRTMKHHTIIWVSVAQGHLDGNQLTMPLLPPKMKRKKLDHYTIRFT